MSYNLPSQKRLDLIAKVNPLWNQTQDWSRSLDIGDGWIDLVSDLVDKLLDTGIEFSVLQIKEKFGGLRFYISSLKDPHSKLSDIISTYEKQSYETCEVCGEPGTPRKGYWIKTLCDKDAEPYDVETK